MSTRFERWNALLDMLGDGGELTVERMAHALGVSAATIRRDLDELAQQQLLMRTRGGAVASTVSYDLPLRYKSARHAPEKQRIATAAAALVAPGAIVGLNGGTTTTEVARALAVRSDLHTGDAASTITVVTNALNIASELVVRRHVKVVITGGVARPQTYELIGPLATLVPSELSVDVTFLGVNAVDPDTGASTHDEGEAQINHLLATRARQVVVVADSSKLGASAFARICGAEEIDVVVTDTDAPPAMVRSFEDRGVRVLTV